MSEPVQPKFPCPSCKGRCCVNKHGSPAEHGAALALHSCPDCEQGMNREPCPECKGKCCRDQDYGYRVEHMGAECYEHVCEVCLDGDKYVPPRTVKEERADVVAYLSHALSYGFTAQSAHDPRAASPALYLTMLRDLIAEGEHVGWAKKEKA